MVAVRIQRTDLWLSEIYSTSIRLPLERQRIPVEVFQKLSEQFTFGSSCRWIFYIPVFTIPFWCTRFYVCGVTIIGLLVPSNDPKLTGGGTAAASPFVIAINHAGIKTLPSIINAALLTSGKNLVSTSDFILLADIFSAFSLVSCIQRSLCCFPSFVYVVSLPAVLASHRFVQMDFRLWANLQRCSPKYRKEAYHTFLSCSARVLPW